jgi:hypothetical protein
MSVALGMGAIEDAALARLTSQSPCPDRVQAARVRYYPDVNVELVDVLRSRMIAVNYEGTIGADETFTDYRLRTVLRGKPSGASTNVRHSTSISSPTQSGEGIVNPVPPFLRAGGRALLFSGSTFESCRIVPATLSAVSAVQSAVPVSRYREDGTTRLFM